MANIEAVVLEAPEGHHHAYAVPFPSFVGGRVLVMGFAVEETTGTATARAVIYDGTDQTSKVLLPIRLNPGESTDEWFGDGGWECRVGALAVVTSGAVDGLLMVKDIRH